MTAPAEKRSLRELSAQPPNYETPLEYFREPVQPNDVFFVRSHLSGLPDENSARDWRLTIGGDAAAKPIAVGLDELKSFPAHEITAICYCSGNRRSFFPSPLPPGVAWGYGGMGNAVWKGARLKDVLAKAGVKQNALEIAIAGADQPAPGEKPPFVKSLPTSKALDDNTLLAYEMNGEKLPLLNGFPLRLVVPGWVGTYWVKHVSALEIRATPFVGHWMTTDYRVPQGKFAVIERFETQETKDTAPNTEILVNSLVTSHADGEKISRDMTNEISGIAWDGGYGVSKIEVSADGGKGWSNAALDAGMGRFAFHSWRFSITPKQAGPIVLLVRASNRRGQVQPLDAIPNPQGYYNNAVQRLALIVA